MAKQIMLAVAGAGKTHYICNSIDPNNKNLILAYTHENIRNIKHELINAFGFIPNLTSVMTFDSFVYRFLLCPYEPTILSHFGKSDFVKKGITTTDPPSKVIPGTKYSNPNYVKKEKFEHYITPKGFYYCATMSELIMQVKNGKNSLIKKAAINLNSFFDQIMIDEFQDFREYDFDLIVALSKHINNVLLVGDYHQHSVSAKNNTGRPFMKGKTEISYNDFKDFLLKNDFEIDETTLNSSYRCCPEICSFIKNKLSIEINAKNTGDGKVIWVENSNIEKILKNDSVVKLVYNNAHTYYFKSINWSYSKGDTLDNVCVILTDKFDSMDEENYKPINIPSSTINKLYVAFTRTKGKLYIIKNSLFKSVKGNYKKQ